MRVAPKVELSDEERRVLKQWARSRSLPARQVERARVILLAAEGRQDREIAAELRITNQKASRWRKRFLQFGIGGLEKDAPRSGRRPGIPDATVQRVMQITTREKPPRSAHWSARAVAAVTGVSEASVRRIWRAHGWRPRQSAVDWGLHLPGAPDDVVGLYLDPPEHALALRRRRGHPALALRRRGAGPAPSRAVRDAKGQFLQAMSALDVRPARSIPDSHRRPAWLSFLRRIGEVVPLDCEVLLFVDHSHACEPPDVRDWLEAHPRVQVHLIAAGPPWLATVGRLFDGLAGQRAPGDVLSLVAELVSVIADHTHSRRAGPFVWTAVRQRAHEAGH